MALAAVLILGGTMAVISQDGNVNHGKEVYAMQKCALCHSISGIGGKKMALDGVGSRTKPEALRRWIRTPKEMKADTTMKAYPNLPENDLADLVAFLATLK